MEKERNTAALNDVLDYYLMSSAETGMDTLAETIERYPQYQDDLRELAAFRKLTSIAAEDECTTEDIELLHSRGISVVQNLLYQRRQDNASGNKPEAFSSLRDEIDRQYSDPAQFYQRTGLSEGILWTIDDRQAIFQTIARKAILNIADALGKQFVAIAEYLQGEVRLSTSYYKAEEAPEVVRCSFSDLVRMDDDLSAEQKAYWLVQPSMASSENSQEEGSES